MEKVIISCIFILNSISQVTMCLVPIALNALGRCVCVCARVLHVGVYCSQIPKISKTTD